MQRLYNQGKRVIKYRMFINYQPGRVPKNSCRWARTIQLEVLSLRSQTGSRAQALRPYKLTNDKEYKT
ncbi:hypothetical protein [Coleofasciculus sp. E1-EBD-02]|uniref:hypothetical protein n=1 Tax=Coleofasciculus sp. E1-EBD-02 TaxID=3068481 RepID=UPI0032FA851B